MSMTAAFWEVCSKDCYGSQIRVASEQAEMWTWKNKVTINADKTNGHIILQETPRDACSKPMGKQSNELGVMLSHDLG